MLGPHPRNKNNSTNGLFALRGCAIRPNYSSWSLRGWLLCRMAGLQPSFLVPCLTHEDAKVWDTLAIAEYLREIKPRAGILPSDRIQRAHCRSISGEMHSGFANLRSALPMNLKAHFPGFKVWAGALPDIQRIETIWRECLSTYGGPFLFGEKPTLADAMYAPVAARFTTYDVKLDAACAGYCKTIMAWQPMVDWIESAKAEPEEIEELDVEF
eukprot:gene20815-21523_t